MNAVLFGIVKDGMSSLIVKPPDLLVVHLDCFVTSYEYSAFLQNYMEAVVMFSGGSVIGVRGNLLSGGELGDEDFTDASSLC